jgi:hypothetical protein
MPPHGLVPHRGAAEHVRVGSAAPSGSCSTFGPCRVATAIYRVSALSLYSAGSLDELGAWGATDGRENQKMRLPNSRSMITLAVSAGLHRRLGVGPGGHGPR